MDDECVVLGHRQGGDVLTAAIRTRGMTLVEIAVGLVIVGLLMVLALPNFSQWLQNSQIRTAAEVIQSGLQLARTEAVRRNIFVQFVLGAGSAWTVGCAVPDLGDADADGQPDCPATIQSRAAAEGTVNAVVTTSEVVANTGAAAAAPLFAGTVTFNGMGRVVTTGVSASLVAGDNAIYAISNPTGGSCAAVGPMRCLRVVVSTGGQVRMCDPALASTDPRGC